MELPIYLSFLVLLVRGCCQSSISVSVYSRIRGVPLGGPKHIYVAPLASIGYGFWFPTGEYSLAAKGAEQRGCWLRSAREIGKEQIEGERLRGIQMMKILVPLNVRVRRKEGACFFKEVPRKVRAGKDVFFGYLTSSVQEDSRFANAEMPPFIISEMLLEYVLIAHSLPLLHHGEKYAVNAAVSTACRMSLAQQSEPSLRTKVRASHHHAVDTCGQICRCRLNHRRAHTDCNRADTPSGCGLFRVFQYS